MPRFFLYFVGLQLKVAKVVGGAHRRGTSEPEESDGPRLKTNATIKICPRFHTGICNLSVCPMLMVGSSSVDSMCDHVSKIPHGKL